MAGHWYIDGHYNRKTKEGVTLIWVPEGYIDRIVAKGDCLDFLFGLETRLIQAGQSTNGITQTQLLESALEVINHREISRLVRDLYYRPRMR